MLDGLLTMLTGGVGGGIIGLAGSWLTKRENRKTLELQIRRDLSLAKYEAEADARQLQYSVTMAEKQLEQSQAEGEIAMDIAETDAFAESLKSQLKPSGVKFVDGFRALMRPLITLYLLAITGYFAVNVHTLINGLDALSRNELLELYSLIISQLLFLTNLAVSWWFGSRGDKHGVNFKLS